MKRVQTAFARLTRKAKSIQLSPEASAVIVKICKVASTINFPFCETACTAVIEFINMVETANANDQHWKGLLETIDGYASRVTEFAVSICVGKSPDYIALSPDLRAVIAREAIADVERAISLAKTKVEARLKDGKIRKRLGANAIQSEIQECQQSLATALDHFNGRVLNILCMTAEGSQQRAPSDDFDIPGARPLLSQDIEVLDDFDVPSTVAENTFWSNLVHAKIGDTVRVAKVYCSEKGAKDQFEEDMKFFARFWGPRVARIYGYNTTSRTPFMVFTIGSAIPFVEYLVQLWRSDPENFLLHGWKLFGDLHRAGRFLSNVSDIRSIFYMIEDSIKDAAVDSKGQVIVAPPRDYCRYRLLGHYEKWDASARMIGKLWTTTFALPLPLKGVLADDADVHRRCLRPFVMAIRGNSEEFLNYRTETIPSSSAASSILYQWWPLIPKRNLHAQIEGFPGDIIAGDLGVFETSLDGKPRFRVLTNITDLLAGRYSDPPSEGTAVPRVYRKTIYSIEDRRTERLAYSLDASVLYNVGRDYVESATLARHFKSLGKHHGIPPSQLGLVIMSFTRLRWEDIVQMRKACPPGHPIRRGITMSLTGGFSSARWSLHDPPSTDEEKAAEKKINGYFPDPLSWKDPKSSAISYWQVEDEDIGFYSEEPSNLDRS